MRRKIWTLPAAGVLLALYWWMATSVSPRHGPAADEVAHLTAGYAYWTTGDLRLQPENGNLPQRWAALPLLAQPPRFPPPAGPAWREADVGRVGFQFFFGLGNDPARVLAAGRRMIALFGVALGALVFAWSRSLFRTAGGLVSLALAAFSPTLLAHGGLVTSDLAVGACFLAATLAWWRLAHRVTAGRVVLAGLALGALALAKFSAVVFLPLAAVMLVVRLGRRAALPVRLGGTRVRVRGWRRAAVLAAAGAAAALLAVAAIWTAYDFRFAAAPPGEPGPTQFQFSWDAVLLRPNPTPAAVQPGEKPGPDFNPARLRAGWPQAVIAFARDHRLLPEAYLYGLAYVFRFAAWRPAFLDGETRATGWWQFFPVAFAIKTPLPLFGLLALAAVAIASGGSRRSIAGPPLALPAVAFGEGGVGRPNFRRGGLAASAGPTPTDPRRTRLFYRLSPLLLLLAVYWVFAVASHLNIGHRHLLPTYPALFVLAGAAGGFLRRPFGPAGILTAALLGWFVAESWWIRPDYLAYFNELAGGPAQGYRHLVDSSLDWGQDLPGLKAWLGRHERPGEPVFLSYFGSDDPISEGIQATRVGDDFFDLRPRPALPAMTGGLYCISATMFQRVYTVVRGPWTAAREQEYESLARWAAQFAKHPDPEQGRDLEGRSLTRAQVLDRLFELGQLRFGRLCHYLRDRTPDAEVGYSILIFRLTDEQVRQALGIPLQAGS